jgi:hypothetical protein
MEIGVDGLYLIITSSNFEVRIKIISFQLGKSRLEDSK